MIPEAPFLFAMAALNASVAGLAGLVAGLRRGADLRPIDRIRLRQIVEFAFANILLALGIVPLALILGDLAQAIRIGAAVTIVYDVTIAGVLVRRIRHAGIPFTRGWAIAVAIVNFSALAAAAWALAVPSFGQYALTLILMVARPMLAFLLVLDSFEPD